MNRLAAALRERKLSLFVSLPANDEAMAEAALQEGAHGLKVHANVGHRASGNHFHGLAQYRETFARIRGMYDGPLGIVPGDKDRVVREEIAELERMGFDFFSLYAHHIPSFLLERDAMARTFATDSRFDLSLLEAAKAYSFTALEASVVPGEEYGTSLSLADLLKYRLIAERSGLPVIVPSQRMLTPEDVPALADCGVRVLLIGAIVTGTTAEGIRRAVFEFRNAVDQCT